jgi:hypothetical protein
MKLKDWPKHIEELLRLRPDLAEAHVVQEVRCVGAQPLQLWDAEHLPAKDVQAGPYFIYPELFEWEEGEYPVK